MDRSETREVVEAEVLVTMMVISGDVDEQNLVAFGGRLVHQQDDHLVGLVCGQFGLSGRRCASWLPNQMIFL